MNCTESQSLLEAFVDGELDAARTVEIEAHMGTCPQCAAAVERLEALHTAISTQAPYYTAPAGLRRNLEGKLRPRQQRPWWPMLAAACLLAAVGIWRIAPSPFVPAQALEREVVSAHVRSLLAEHLMDVPSTDRHTVKPWFAGKLDFAPVVEDLSAQDFTLVGGRLDYLNGRTVAALVYRRRQHTINVFTWPDTGREQAPRTESTQGFNVVHWSNRGMAWWAVSDLGAEELAELPRLL